MTSWLGTGKPVTFFYSVFFLLTKKVAVEYAEDIHGFWVAIGSCFMAGFGYLCLLIEHFLLLTGCGYFSLLIVNEYFWILIDNEYSWLLVDSRPGLTVDIPISFGYIV